MPHLDFLGYDDGSVAYFHIAEEKFDIIIPQMSRSMKSLMDVSPIAYGSQNWNILIWIFDLIQI